MGPVILGDQHALGHQLGSQRPRQTQPKANDTTLARSQAPLTIPPRYSRYGTSIQKGPSDIVGYGDSGFKTDPAIGKSQTGYIFIKNGAPISWGSTKQTVTATSTNHAELLAFHEASRKAIWLRTIQDTISQMAGFQLPAKPTTIFEDNAACIEQVSSGFITADRVKHISPHIFGYTQDLTESKQIEVRKIASAENIADVLTKALPAPQHRKLIAAAGMRTLSELES